MKFKFKHLSLSILIACGLSAGLFAQMGDKVSYRGSGNNANIDVFRVDTNGGIHVWDQFLRLGDKAVGQSTTAPSLPSTSSYYGLQVPFFNSGPTLNAGDIVLAKASATATGYGVKAAVLATTTVMGINYASLASNATGWMTINGFAIINTTGTVNIGDIIITTDTVSGYGGAKSSPAAGTIVGVAVSVGTAAGGSTLVRLKL